MNTLQPFSVAGRDACPLRLGEVKLVIFAVNALCIVIGLVAIGAFRVAIHGARLVVARRARRVDQNIRVDAQNPVQIRHVNVTHEDWVLTGSNCVIPWWAFCPLVNFDCHGQDYRRRVEIARIVIWPSDQNSQLSFILSRVNNCWFASFEQTNKI